MKECREGFSSEETSPPTGHRAQWKKRGRIFQESIKTSPIETRHFFFFGSLFFPARLWRGFPGESAGQKRTLALIFGARTAVRVLPGICLECGRPSACFAATVWSADGRPRASRQPFGARTSVRGLPGNRLERGRPSACFPTSVWSADVRPRASRHPFSGRRLPRPPHNRRNRVRSATRPCWVSDQTGLRRAGSVAAWKSWRQPPCPSRKLVGRVG